MPSETRSHLLLTAPKLNTTNLMKKHKFAIAWDVFKEENPKTFDAATLGNIKEQNRYLDNRLWHAFTAGWDAHHKHTLKKRGKK